LQGSTSERVRRLHLVATEVFVVKIFQPAPQLVLSCLIGGVRDDFGYTQDVLIHENRAIGTQGESQGIRWAAVDRNCFAVLLQPEDCLKGIVLELSYDDPLHRGI